MGQIASNNLIQSLSSTQLDLIRRVANEAHARGFPLYAVGGLPRDILLRKPIGDLDLVVEGNAIELARSLASKYGGKVTAHTKFGTAKIDVQGWGIESSDSLKDQSRGTIDLISARSETYRHPGALPTVKMGTIEDDIRRRDFTINTLAIRLDGAHFGELRDDFGGLSDLESRRVCVLHTRSFLDDPTRMFRAARYEQRYSFRIADESLALIPEACPLVAKLSAQRVRHEFDAILEEPKVASILARLAELNLLKAVHAALPGDKSIRMRLEAEPRPELLTRHRPGAVEAKADNRDLRWILWLITLSPKELESVNKRLHFTAARHEALVEASKLFVKLHSFVNLKPSQWVERLEGLPGLAVYATYLAAANGKPKNALESYLAEWRHVRPKTTGHDLKRLGLEPGPKYKSILRELQSAWLDGKIQSHTEEMGYLERLLEKS